MDMQERKTTLPAPPQIPESEIHGQFRAQVVVVGEGLAGLSCALSARQQGADTLIVTGSQAPVGRGGSIFAAYSKVMEEQGIPRQDTDNFILQEFAANGFLVDQRKWYKLFNRSEEAMNWLIDLTRAAGYSVTLEDANEDDPDSPTYQPPGTHAVVSPDTARAGVGIHFALKTLEKAFLAAGGRILRCSAACKLEKKKERVTAVLCRMAESGYVRVLASQAVVLATGDFSASPELMQKYCPQYAPYFTAGGDNYDVGFAVKGLYRGEGHMMALWAGAAWQRTWPCAVMVQGSRLGSHLPYGSHRGLRMNKFGLRYCNEDMNGAYTALTTLREPEGKAYAVWDHRYAQALPWRTHGGRRTDPNTPPETVYALWESQIKTGQLLRRDSLPELLEALGLPTETAMETIRHYNDLCHQGKDPDFHKKAAYLQPIEEGPFYGCSLSDRLFFSVMGGPRTNDRMQICNEQDEPIPGLYCVGSMVGDLYAGCYNFRVPGMNYGACLTFGYLTGKEAAAERP